MFFVFCFTASISRRKVRKLSPPGGDSFGTFARDIATVPQRILEAKRVGDYRRCPKLPGKPAAAAETEPAAAGSLTKAQLAAQLAALQQQMARMS